MDNNTTKVLLAAIPSGAFVIIVALVIFGLAPGDCIEIEAPGGGKLVRCKPMPDSASTLSTSQIESIQNQIEELKNLQSDQQQKRLTDLEERGVIDNAPEEFVPASSAFQQEKGSLLEQIRLLTNEEAEILTTKLNSDKLRIDELNKVAENLITKGKNFDWPGEWQVKGTVSILDLSYEGKFIFNEDGTYESSGYLDGKTITGSGTYLINEELGTCKLIPSSPDSKSKQYSFVKIGDKSFSMWSPLNFEKLEFTKVI